MQIPLQKIIMGVGTKLTKATTEELAKYAADFRVETGLRASECEFFIEQPHGFRGWKLTIRKVEK